MKQLFDRLRNIDYRLRRLSDMVEEQAKNSRLAAGLSSAAVEVTQQETIDTDDTERLIRAVSLASQAASLAGWKREEEELLGLVSQLEEVGAVQPTLEVVTYRYAFVEGSVSLCDECSRTESILFRFPSLGSVEYGKRLGYCRGCQYEAWKAASTGPQRNAVRSVPRL